MTLFQEISSQNETLIVICIGCKNEKKLVLNETGSLNEKNEPFFYFLQEFALVLWYRMCLFFNARIPHAHDIYTFTYKHTIHIFYNSFISIYTLFVHTLLPLFVLQ